MRFILSGVDGEKLKLSSLLGKSGGAGFLGHMGAVHAASSIRFMKK